MDVANGEKTLRLSVTPGPPSSRRAIRFEGNSAIRRKDLEAVVTQNDLEVQGWIDRTTLDETLTTFYRNEGYLAADVQVGAPVLEDGSAVLPVTIQEGPRAVIREVRWAGVSEARLALVKDNANLHAQQPYTLAAVNTARDHVERHYRTQGFNSVQVAATAVPIDSTATVDVDFTITEGAQEILKEVVTSGTTRTRNGVLIRALRLRVGQPANAEEWSLARKRVFDTNVFRTVDIQSVPIGDPVDGVQPVQARVTVEEYPPWRLRYGVQVDRERENQESESVDQAGPLHPEPGRRLAKCATRTCSAAPSPPAWRRASSATSSASTPSCRTPASSACRCGPGCSSMRRTRTSSSMARRSPSSSCAASASSSAGAGGGAWRSPTATATSSTTPTSPMPLPDDPFALPGHEGGAPDAGGAATTGATIPPDSHRGTFSSASLDQASNWLGSDTSYRKILAQQYAFWRVGPVVLASRAIGGTTYGSDNPTDRFQAGGATTVRGYAENSLGGRDIFGDVIGGDELLILNQELRFPIYRWFRGVAFVDAGNAFSELQPFAFGDLAVGYGAGLRLSSPIGLLRLDFGIPATTHHRIRRAGANAVGSGRVVLRPRAHLLTLDTVLSGG